VQNSEHPSATIQAGIPDHILTLGGTGIMVHRAKLEGGPSVAKSQVLFFLFEKNLRPCNNYTLSGPTIKNKKEEEA
jgi:hypothetical protein